MNLKTARRLKGISQSQLARQAGLEPSTISDIELGRNRNPSWTVVYKISQALGVEPEEIFTPSASAGTSK